MTDDEKTCEEFEGSSGLSAGGSVLGVGSEISDLSAMLAGGTPQLRVTRIAYCGFWSLAVTQLFLMSPDHPTIT